MEGANAQDNSGGRGVSFCARGRLRPATAGRAGANVLLGGSSNQFTLQPVSVEGSVGLNAAAGVAAVSLRKVP